MVGSLVSGLLLASVLIPLYLLMARWVSDWNADALAAAGELSAESKSLNQFAKLILQKTIASMYGKQAIRRVALLSLLLPALSCRS
jgi:hypothetical protein